MLFIRLDLIETFNPAMNSVKDRLIESLDYGPPCRVLSLTILIRDV